MFVCVFLHVCVCMSVCLCANVYVCVYMCICVHMCFHVYMHVYICLCVSVYSFSWFYVCTHMPVFMVHMQRSEDDWGNLFPFCFSFIPEPSQYTHSLLPSLCCPSSSELFGLFTPNFLSILSFMFISSLVLFFSFRTQETPSKISVNSQERR